MDVLPKNIALTFDDVLMRPVFSDVEPGATSLKTEIIRGLFLDMPLLSAAMDKVTEARMAITLGKLGALGVLHRNCSISEQVKMVEKVKKANVFVGAACGPFDRARALALEKALCDAIFIDCAHGHNKKVILSARAMKKELKRAKLVVGNIATKEAAQELVPFADAIKVGVGPGSICTTRVVSGVGIPQFSAIREVARVAQKKHVSVIADGGIRNSGDIAKALAAGASSVMIGNLFAGTTETPGRIVIKNGKKYKEYRGMGSCAARKKRMIDDRYLGKDGESFAEGVEAFIAYRGPSKKVVSDLCSGIQIAMGYVGASTISVLQKKAQFVYITKAGVREGQPHNLDFMKK